MYQATNCTSHFDQPLLTKPMINMTTQSDNDAAIIHLLHKHGIKVMIFDMDQTAVACHSQGCLLRSSLHGYLEQSTPAFRHLVPLLHRHGFPLAMATHSDSSEYTDTICPDTHIIGQELAKEVLMHNFDNEIVDSFCIVAYNPKCYADGGNDMNQVKRYHMRVIRNHYNVKCEEMLILDDTKEVIDDCRDHCHVHAVYVDGSVGLRGNDLLDYLRALETRY
jgi:hypothetical protein